MTRRICVVTGSRAEYGLLRWVMQGIRDTTGLELQVIATGMHLAPEFGETYREVERDGFAIDRKVEMLLSSDTGEGLAKSTGLGMIGFADALRDLAPDVVLVLGDRFEVLPAATAALFLRIPVAHLHGGEVTEGAFDDALRHSITKMSHLHFVAAEQHRQRVIQLGEQPDRVYRVGALGLDGIARLPVLGRAELEASLGLEFGERSLLVTFHPATLGRRSAVAEMEELLAALDELEDTSLIFTMPNADTEGRALQKAVRQYVERRPRAAVFTSLGHQRYLSCMRQVEAVVGNSSSGLIEAPALGRATVNIGDRQRGRLRGDSVIDCVPEKASILAALARVRTAEFQRRLASAVNPYGEPGASERIVRVLREVALEGLVAKSFHDLPPVQAASGMPGP